MAYQRFSSEFLEYLATCDQDLDESNRLPSLNDLSEEMNISVSRLREQLEVAKALGFVKVRPRLGIRLLPYSFLPAVWSSLSYALSLDMKYFEDFSNLRNQIEDAFWDKAVRLLTEEDHLILCNLMERAWEKLNGTPIRIPHEEHRKLHLYIYQRLDNPFVVGLLEAYWEAYEAVGLNLYAEYDYLQDVWKFHQKMVDAICEGDFEAGHRALIEHTDLIYHRPGS